MPKLPLEVLQLIVQQLYEYRKGPDPVTKKLHQHGLATMMRVSKACHQLAAPVLYGHIHLANNEQLSAFSVGLFDEHWEAWETTSEDGSDSSESTDHAADLSPRLPYTKHELLDMVRRATMYQYWSSESDPPYYVDDFTSRDISVEVLRQVAFHRHAQTVHPEKTMYGPHPLSQFGPGLSEDYYYRQPFISICKVSGSPVREIKKVETKRDAPHDPDVMPRILINSVHDVELKPGWENQIAPACWNKFFLTRCSCEHAGLDHGHGRGTMRRRFVTGLQHFSDFWQHYDITGTIIELVLPSNVDERLCDDYTDSIEDALFDDKEVVGFYNPIEHWLIADNHGAVPCEVCGMAGPATSPSSTECRLYCGASDESDGWSEEDEWYVECCHSTSQKSRRLTLSDERE